MSRYHSYLPILKSKGGEFRAVKELDSVTRRRVTPFFDVVRVTWDYAKARPTKPLEDHLASIAKNIAGSWGANERFFCDCFDLALDSRTANRGHPLTSIFGHLRNSGVLGVPVTGLDRDTAYEKATRKIVAADRRGLCVRLLREDLEDRITLNVELARLMSRVGVSRGDVDLVMDLRSLSADSVKSTVRLVSKAIGALPGVREWRTLTLAASAFPETLGAIKSKTTGLLPRSELDLWERLIGNHTLPRKPAFGDYAIAHPDMPDLDHRKITPSASIRYCLDRQWLVLRGESLKKGKKFAQFHDLSRQLVSRTEYAGPSFSWGDRYVTRNALGTEGPGNLMTWRGVGTNHHLTLVGAQIASQFSP